MGLESEIYCRGHGEYLPREQFKPGITTKSGMCTRCRMDKHNARQTRYRRAAGVQPIGSKGIRMVKGESWYNAAYVRSKLDELAERMKEAKSYLEDGEDPDCVYDHEIDAILKEMKGGKDAPKVN